ncbi:hypothetical protein FRC06_002453 [Ceratobasidium sp. 370]|nr:hypothetical protein FRC06_002453 [Ceratobasidium sp. 370]
MSRYTTVPLHSYSSRGRYGSSGSRRGWATNYSTESGDFRTESSNPSIYQTTSKTPATTWAYITLPLFLHFILTLGITLLVFFYVNRNYFSLVHRMPVAVLLDGSTQPLDAVYFRPLQSDMTTILSFFLAISRIFAAVWCGSLCWRCAIILMERSGITLGELGRMVSYGLPPFRVQPRLDHRHRGSAYTVVIAVTLLLVLPVQFASPIITGSITWAPFFQQYNAPNLSVIVRHLRDDDPAPTLGSPFILRSIVTTASASGFRVWGGVNQDTGAMQRVLGADSAQLLFILPANSSLNNITMPYFKITSFEWLADPELTLTPDQLGAIDVSNPARWTNVSVEFNPLQMMYSVAIVATPQELLASRLSTQTYPVAFAAITSINQCNWDGWGFAKTAPTNAGLVYRKFPSGITVCYAFATVTYDMCVDRAPVKDTALVGLFLDTRDLAEYDESLATAMAHIHKGTVISLRREKGRLLSRVQVE